MTRKQIHRCGHNGHGEEETFVISRIIALILLFILPVSAMSGQSGLETAEYQIPASLGTLYGVLQKPEGKEPVPLVITCHGFGGNHTGALDYAEYVAEGGDAVFSLDFCGGGWLSKSDGTMPEMSVLTEAKDLNAVIDYFRADPRFTDIFLRGESQGGFVASYVAAERPEDIAGLILEYPAYVLQDDARRRQRADGSFPEYSTLLGMRIGRIYSEDVVSFDIYEHMAAYGGPVQILHGDRDRLVPMRYSERAAEVYQNAELIVMPGQGHGFLGTGRQDAMEKELAFLDAVEAGK